VVEAHLVFQRDAQGAIKGVVLHQNGQALPGKRKP
jgi:D-alanyl-D-alanine-carboxypeptidase/D-alanyl-D-alanine-endopeptidase